MPASRAASSDSCSDVTQRSASRHVVGVQLLDEVVGAHDEHGQARRGGRDLADVEDRLGGLDHRPEPGVLGSAGGLERRPRATAPRRPSRPWARRRPPDPACGCRGEVGLVPPRADAVDPDRHLAVAVVARCRCGTGVLARRLLVVGPDGVLEVEDEPVDGQRPGLLEGALVRARHVEHRTTRRVCRLLAHQDALTFGGR